MGQARFRHYPIYIRNRKVAEFNAGAYDMESGDELQYGSEGILGVSDGIINLKLEGDAVIPVSGTSIDFTTIFLGKQYVSVMIRVNGKRHVWVGRLTSMNYNSASKNGEAKGKFTFIGTEDPNITS
jgi:hypothetical protein